MNRKLEVAKNLLAEILNYLMILAAGVVFLTDFAKASANMAELCAIGMLSFLFYAVRVKCRSFFLFLFLHMLPCALVIFLYEGNTFQKIWLFLTVLILGAASFGKKMQGKEAGMETVFPPVFGAVIWILYLIDQRQGSGACAELLFHIAAGFLAGYFLYFFLRQFLHYMDINNRTTENIPVNHVFRSSALLAGGFALMAEIIMLLCVNREWLEEVGGAVHRAVISFLTFLLSLIPKGSIEEAESTAGYGAPEAMPWDGAEVTEPPFILKILEVLLGLFALGVVVGLAVMAIAGIIRLIRERFAQRSKLRLPKDETHIDRVEKIKRDTKRDRKGIEESIFKRAGKVWSPEERIRRIYRRTIEKRMSSLDEKEKEVFRPAKTPRECCTVLFEEQKDAALAFAVLYEKARYGPGSCDGEDVKKARKLAEEFHG